MLTRGTFHIVAHFLLYLPDPVLQFLLIRIVMPRCILETLVPGQSCHSGQSHLLLFKDKGNKRNAKGKAPSGTSLNMQRNSVLLSIWQQSPGPETPGPEPMQSLTIHRLRKVTFLFGSRKAGMNGCLRQPALQESHRTRLGCLWRVNGFQCSFNFKS